jgi:hypothetical protein
MVFELAPVYVQA